MAQDGVLEEIEKIYRLRNPEKLKQLPRLLARWKGKEGQLLEKIKLKYMGRRGSAIRSTGALLEDCGSPNKLRIRKEEMLERAKSMSALTPASKMVNNFVHKVDQKHTETQMVFHTSVGARPAERSRKIFDSCGYQIDSTRRTAPQVTFKCAAKKPGDDNQGQNYPGPGSYKRNPYVGGYQPDSTIPSAPEPTMGGREVFGGTVDFTEAKHTPGPQNYIPRNPEWDKERRAPSYSMYDRNYVRTEAEKNPGPGEYLYGHMSDHLDQVKPRPWGVPFVKQKRDRDAIYIPVNKQRDETPCGPGEYGQGVEMSGNQYEGRYPGKKNACFGKCARDEPAVDPIALAQRYSNTPGSKLLVSSIGAQVDSTKETAPKCTMSGRNWFGDTNNVSELYSKLGRQSSLTNLKSVRRRPIR